MALSPLDKQTASCNLPRAWLMNLAMDCVICRSENGTNGCHLVLFSVDVAFTLHLVAPHHPLLSNPIGVLIVLAMPVKVAQLSTYPFNSWCIDRVWIAIELWQIAYKHLFSSQDKILQTIKIGIYNINFVIVHGSWVFSNLVTNL